MWPYGSFIFEQTKIKYDYCFLSVVTKTEEKYITLLLLQVGWSQTQDQFILKFYYGLGTLSNNWNSNYVYKQSKKTMYL